MTSNREFLEWDGVFGDDVVAATLLDRRLHYAVLYRSRVVAIGCVSTRPRFRRV